MEKEYGETRNKKIYAESLNGASFQELSEKYSVSASRIREIVKNEKKKDAYHADDIYIKILSLTEDKKNATRAYTVLNRLGVNIKEEIIKIDRNRLKKTRSCGPKTEELIMKLKEVIEMEIE